MKHDSQSRKWQITINNPLDKGLTHAAIMKFLSQIKSIVYVCCADEIGIKEHTPHTHVYIACSSSVRFSTLKKRFPEAHFEVARGSHTENRDYICKEGKWKNDDKHGTQIPNTFEEWGELPEERGKGYRSDLEMISEMIDSGMNPSEIFKSDFRYYKHERLIRSAYFAKRTAETPVMREVKLHYIVGDSGSGKSYTYVSLCEEFGESNIFFLTDYESGGFDTYSGEKFLFMDEYKGQFPFSKLLTLTDVYKSQIHTRYTNAVSLWDEIFITSVYPPEALYEKMVESDLRGIDKQRQLFRRITDITYCFVDYAGKYRKFTIPMSKYTDYEELKSKAIKELSPKQLCLDDFEEVEDVDYPF